MSDFIVKPCGESIQDAIDTAAWAGGGRVVLAPGVHLSGTIYLKSNVELHVEAGAILKGHSSPELYDDFCDPGFDAVAPENSRKCLIAAANASNIAITGQGEINGSGPDFYDTNVPGDSFYAKPPHPRPRMVQFFNCNNIRIEGTSFVDSPGWTFWLIECHDVMITRVRVTGNQRMINNDGIDIDCCRRVTVSDSFFRTGDDCLILRAIPRSPKHHPVCEDVTVTNCTLDSRCQGIRIGCPSDEEIRNCLFSNIVIHGTGNGININNPVRYLTVGSQGRLRLSNLIFNNFVIDSGGVPLWLNVENGVKLRRLGGMTFSNFRIKSPEPVRLDGCPDTWIRDVTLNDFCIETTAPTPIVTSYVDRLAINRMTCIHAVP